MISKFTSSSGVFYADVGDISQPSFISFDMCHCLGWDYRENKGNMKEIGVMLSAVPCKMFVKIIMKNSCFKYFSPLIKFDNT